MKRILSAALAVLLLAAPVPRARAASAEAEAAAEELRSLGLYRGVGIHSDGTPDLALDQRMSRNQAAILMVRMMGEEPAAMSQIWEVPFPDVAPQSLTGHSLGYASANGYYLPAEGTWNGTAPVSWDDFFVLTLSSMGNYWGFGNSGVDPSDTAASMGLLWDLDAPDGLTRGTAAILAVRVLDQFMSASGDQTRAMTLREARGLGESPMITDQLMPAKAVFTASRYPTPLENLSANKVNFTLVEQVDFPEGSAFYYEELGRYYRNYDWETEVTPGLSVIFSDGTRMDLSLPHAYDNGPYAAPLDLHYDADRNALVFEAVITRDLIHTEDRFRRAGRIRFVFDLEERRCRASELERSPSGG